MKEYIQKNGDEVAIVIYDAPLPPRYFRLTRRFIKTLFIVVPIFLSVVLFALFTWGLSSRLKDVPTPALPEVVSEADTKVSALEAEVSALQESNKALASKLAAGPTVATAEDPHLMVIKKPYGMQNLLSKNKVTLDQFELVQDPKKIALKFQIISSTPETKVTGHVLVFMISEAGMLVYPKDANASVTQGVKYSSGEPFSVSRLRPTTAEFVNISAEEAVKFVVYIFSREGDLLLIRETEPFKLGAKQ